MSGPIPDHQQLTIVCDNLILSLVLGMPLLITSIFAAGKSSTEEQEEIRSVSSLSTVWTCWQGGVAWEQAENWDAVIHRSRYK